MSDRNVEEIRKIKSDLIRTLKNNGFLQDNLAHTCLTKEEFDKEEEYNKQLKFDIEVRSRRKPNKNLMILK